MNNIKNKKYKMRKIFFKLSLLAGVIVMFSPTFLHADKVHNIGNNKSAGAQKSMAAGCLPATGVSELNLNNVRARINTGGDMWWDLQGVAKYEIPKNSGKMSMFSASLWLAGVDVNGQLKCAALRYRQVGNDYWPGPLTTDGTAAVDPETCDKYDRHFPITRSEVETFKAWFADPASYPDYVIPKSILDWPAHGDISKKQSYYLAPFFDYNGDGSYDPNDGDYPYYDFENSLCPRNKENLHKPPQPTMEGNGILADQVLKGDQTLWWVFNDKGNVHTESSGEPIGVEIRAQAFCFATNDEINNMTFYSYEIINRSTYRLTGTYFSQWVDIDLGWADDDYVGCDVLRGLGYCCNGKDIDGNGQAWAYGIQPPAVGVDFFQGPYMDPDGLDNPKYDQNGNQICDESINGVNFGDSIVDNERFGMRRFVYHNNSNSGVPNYMTDPEKASEYYNFLRGIWKDGTKMLYGGNAHSSSGAYGPECDFMFPGDTDPCNWGTGGQPPNGPKYWTEKTAGNQPEDRRFMQSAGPFTLEAGAVNYITVGIPWARAAAGGAWASVELLRIVDDKCQRLFDNCFKVVDGPDAPDLTIQELDRELILYISNRKSSNNYNENYQEYDPAIVSPDSLVGSNRYDSIYRFEGYQIFQLKDETVSIADLQDPDKARLVAQCDIKNGISRIINYNYSEALGANVPVEMVNGEDKGIVHSFRILEDKFATGNTRLVNHKKYYYIAIAYAYNNYMTYSEDPGSQIPGIIGLWGQKKPYLAGRKSPTGPINFVTAIPHIPKPESNGTVQNSVYGDGPKIKRIEGQGNGGIFLIMSKESINEIMSGPPYKAANPIYENSAGPINVKVIDPLNVKDADYTVKFDVVNNKIDTARWTLIDNLTGATYPSDKTIKVANEQLFLDLGISITIQQVEKPGSANAIHNGYLGATMIFADSSKRWLTGVPDIDGPGPWNWIRSGTATNAANSQEDDYLGIDDNEDYEKILNGTWAPYRLCSKYEYGPAWANVSLTALNKMENLASVDIVITPDDSKWTRCVVLEMCDEKLLSEGQKDRFTPRGALSVNKYGQPDGSGTTGMGWFPGYAINVETGERLNIMFGENSWLVGENGRDMIWNPTNNYVTDMGQILWGGQHYVYILGHNGDGPEDCPAYDEGVWIKSVFDGPINDRNVFKDIMWAGIPMLAYGYSFKDPHNIPTEVTIRIRVAKPYARYYSTSAFASTSPLNDNYPMYTFNTSDLATKRNDLATAKSALDLINVVPNPYYAYSAYETNQLDNRIKITNLPDKCTVTIYNVSGTLIRQFTKDESKTSIDWDLKNYAGIPISGGLYLIHVKVDGVGERTIKWFGSLRPIDLNSF